MKFAKKTMKISQHQMLEELRTMTINHQARVAKLSELTNDQLTAKKDENSWSILECIEHLNRYGDFYLPEIAKQLAKSPTSKTTFFKAGLLGNYFAQSMLPKEKLNVMKTFASMNPNKNSLNNKVLSKFQFQLTEMHILLEKSEEYSLQKIKTRISISKWIKLRLGDTLRVVIYHNERHIQQAERL